MTGEYCCKDKKCCGNMEEEDDHYDTWEGDIDDMEEEVYYHDVKKNEDEVKREDGYHDTDQRQRLHKHKLPSKV